MNGIIRILASAMLCIAACGAHAGEPKWVLSIGFPIGGEPAPLLGQLSSSFTLVDRNANRWPLLSWESRIGPRGMSAPYKQLRLLNVPLSTAHGLHADGLSAASWSMIGVAALGVISALVLSDQINEKIERCESEEARSDPSCFEQESEPETEDSK